MSDFITYSTETGFPIEDDSICTTPTVEGKYRIVEYTPYSTTRPVVVEPEPEDVIKNITISEDLDGNLTVKYRGRTFPMARILPRAHHKKGKSRYDLALLEEPEIVEYSLSGHYEE